MIYCLVCDIEIPRNVTVEDHIDGNHPSVCSICEGSVFDPIEMESHIESFHPGAHVR